MALIYKKVDDAEIPHDAVRLSEDEALVYQWKIVNNWEKKSDTWALRHASTILGAFSALGGAYINSHYRGRLRLGNYGKLSSYLPIVVVPAMFSILVHKFYVQRNIILRPLLDCPVCLQIRSAALQSSVGVIYPTALAPIASFMFATRHYTYRLPSITAQPLEVFKLWQKFTRPLLPTLGILIAVQGLITMYLTGKELEQIVNLQNIMLQLEREAEERYREKQEKQRASQEQQQAINYFNTAPITN